jgi:hypothetical protein
MDQSCHWIAVFKPLAFIVFHDTTLNENLSRSSYCKGKTTQGFDYVKYARWLCELDKRGFPNLLNVLLYVCEVNGPPVSPLAKLVV